MSLYVLYLAKPQKSENEIKVASIVEQLKVVKRKRDFYLGWIDAKSGDSLSQNDEIYTHGQSSVKINVLNGPEITLFENSLLRIKKVDKNNTISLSKGNLIAKLDKHFPELNIELNGKRYFLKSDHANIQIEQGKLENKFLLLEGKAKLGNQDILPNQMAIVNVSTGSLKVIAIPFISKSPTHNSYHYFLDETHLDFSWTSTTPEEIANLTIAKDSAFKEIYFSEDVKEEFKNIKISEAGTYFWKLSSKDQNSGPVKTFTLIKETPLIVDAFQTILYKGPAVTDKAFINWPKSHLNKYLLKIDFPNNKSETLSLNQNNYEFTPNDIGIYQISVKIDDPSRPLAIWSSPLAISLNEIHPITINSLTPALMEKINYNEQVSNHTLSWSGPTSIKYKIKLTKDDKIKLFETEHTSLTLNLNDVGEYDWEVTGETLSGVSSNKLSGKIRLKAPLRLSQTPSEGAVIELEKPDQLVSFKWDKIQEASTYQFELSDDSEFKKIITSKDIDTNNTSTSIANTGRYFWRVKVNKGEIIEYSNPISVEIRPSPPLSRPETSPPLKIKLKYLEDSSTHFNIFDFFMARAHAEDPMPVAEWNLAPNKKAKSYIVEIYKDKELKEFITRIETQTPHIIWKNAVPGFFYWRVSYVDFWDRKTDFSDVSILETENSIEAVKASPPEIILLQPKHKASILESSKDLIKFSWEKIPNTRLYQLQFSSDLDFNDIILSKKINDTEFTMNCKNFNDREGDYFWKVEAENTTSKRRAFHVSCKPTPTPPPLKKPTPLKSNSLSIATSGPSQHYARISFMPHYLSYTNEANQYSAKINGKVIDSWQIQYLRPVNWNYFSLLSPSIMLSRGKVFNNIVFTDIELNLKSIRKETAFSWGPLIAFFQKTLYIEKNLQISDEKISLPLIGGFIKKDLGLMTTINAEAGIGTSFYFHTDLQIKINNKYSLGTFANFIALTKNDNDHSFTRFGLMFNYTFDFLENE